MKKHIPNFITSLNLLCGSIAVVFAVSGNMKMTALLVFMGIFFDFFDGFMARRFNVHSDLGIQLDSLADMITSGLVPGLVMLHLFELSTTGEGMGWFNISLLGLLITLASAYRLAKFNISTEQKDSFIGLPTPANALLILSFPLIIEFQNSDIMNAVILNKWFLIAVTLISSFLLNAKIRLLAFKFSNWGFKDNAARYLLIILSVVLIAVFQFAAIPLVIVLYIIISLLNR